MFSDSKSQLEKVQLTRDLKDDSILYQGFRLSCQGYCDQGYCDPTTRTQATIVWFSDFISTILPCGLAFGLDHDRTPPNFSSTTPRLRHASPDRQ